MLQANGAATLAGSLTVNFAAGAVLPGRSDTLKGLAAGSPVTGSFANVASGARLTTTDGKGSFVVTYEANSALPNAVTSSHFLAPDQADQPTVTLVADAPTAMPTKGSSALSCLRGPTT